MSKSKEYGVCKGCNRYVIDCICKVKGETHEFDDFDEDFEEQRKRLTGKSYTQEEVDELLNDRWISVDEKLPEKGEKVLCTQNPKTTATKKALFGIFSGKDFMPPTQTIYADYEVGQSRWLDIIYWMPLPEPPKQNQT